MKKYVYLLPILLLACTKEPPKASFEIDKSKAYIGESIKFTNTSVDALSSLWDFGDNTTSEEKNPIHSYQSGGFKTVALTCTNEGGDDVYLSKVEIYDGTSSYQIKNATTTTMTLSSYYWNGNNSEDFINHGNIAGGGLSDTVFTKRDVISLGGILLGVVFIVTDDYPINKQTHNILEINGKTHIYTGKSATILSDNKRIENLKEQLFELSK